MGHLLATVTLNASNGIARDNVVNTFALDRHNVGVPSAGDMTSMADALAAFYNAGQTSGHSIAEYLNGSRTRAAGGLVVRMYNLDGAEQRVRATNSKGKEVWRTPTLGSPVAVFGRTLGAQGAGSSLPAEVAVVLSLRTGTRDTVRTEVPDADGDDAVDRPKARNTGRIYLGPFTTSVLDAASAAGERKIDATVRTTIAQAAQSLHTALKAIGPGPAGTDWCIWSRANGILDPVANIVVDDAFDTMRKRGQAPTASTVAVLV